jgi:hypothetical protein
MSGLPYFESSYSMSAPATNPIVKDIVSGRLPTTVLELFDGIEMQKCHSFHAL